MIYKPKYFASTLDSLAKQVLPEHIYNKEGIAGLRHMDERILITLDVLRKELDKPITVNSWSWGGERNASGYRDIVYYGTLDAYAHSTSQHKSGRALDFQVKGMTAQEVRFFILENKEKFPHIKFLEVGPLSSGQDMNWVHIDCRMQEAWLEDDTIICWSPAFSYVTEGTVKVNKL